MDQQDKEEEFQPNQTDRKTYTRPQVRTNQPIDKAVLYASCTCGTCIDEGSGCDSGAP